MAKYSTPEFNMTAGYYDRPNHEYYCPLCVRAEPYREEFERVTPLVCGEGHAACESCGIDLCLAFDPEAQKWVGVHNPAEVERAQQIRKMAEEQHD